MRVRIFDSVYIPGLGMGPFLNPVEVSPILANIIKRTSKVYRFENTIDSKEEISSSIIEEPSIEEETHIETQEEIVADIEEEPVIEEITDNELTKEELSEMTVDELKKLLKDNDIEFAYKDKKSVLIEKYLNK